MPAVHVSELWVWEIEIWGRFWGCDGWGDAEKPGILPHTGSIYAILKIRSVYVRGPNGKNIENAASGFDVRRQILPAIFYVFSLRASNADF